MTVCVILDQLIQLLSLWRRVQNCGLSCAESLSTLSVAISRSQCSLLMMSVWALQGGEEKIKIERPEGQPVWALAWNPSRLVHSSMLCSSTQLAYNNTISVHLHVCVYCREDHYDVLSVCDWGKKLSYYQLSGRQVRSKEGDEEIFSEWQLNCWCADKVVEKVLLGLISCKLCGHLHASLWLDVSVHSYQFILVPECSLLVA